MTPPQTANELVYYFNRVLLDNSELPLACRTVIDFGFGGGSLSVALFRAGVCNVIAIEIDGDMIQRVKDAWGNSAQIEFVHGDVTNVVLPQKALGVSNPPFGAYNVNLLEEFVEGAMRSTDTLMIVVRDIDERRLSRRMVSLGKSLSVVARGQLAIPKLLPTHRMPVLVLDVLYLLVQNYPKFLHVGDTKSLKVESFTTSESVDTVESVTREDMEPIPVSGRLDSRGLIWCQETISLG
jgi:predicted RNA methylase